MKKPTTNQGDKTSNPADGVSSARAEFVARVMSTKPTPEFAELAARLVQRVRAAKSAPFLERYRRVHHLDGTGGSTSESGR